MLMSVLYCSDTQQTSRGYWKEGKKLEGKGEKEEMGKKGKLRGEDGCEWRREEWIIKEIACVHAGSNLLGYQVASGVEIWHEIDPNMSLIFYWIA